MITLRTNLKDWLIDTRKHRSDSDISRCSVKGYLLGTNCDNYSSYLVELFLKHEPKVFFNMLNGCFCGYISNQKKIWVFTDRYGFGKVYVCETINGAIIGTSFNDIVRRLDKTSLDIVRIYEFVQFSYPLWTKTYIEEIRLLAPGSYLEINSETGKIIREDRYWKYTFSESYRNELPKMEEKLYELLVKAVYDNLNNFMIILIIRMQNMRLLIQVDLILGRLLHCHFKKKSTEYSIHMDTRDVTHL